MSLVPGIRTVMDRLRAHGHRPQAIIVAPWTKKEIQQELKSTDASGHIRIDGVIVQYLDSKKLPEHWVYVRHFSANGAVFIDDIMTAEPIPGSSAIDTRPNLNGDIIPEPAVKREKKYKPPPRSRCTFDGCDAYEVIDGHCIEHGVLRASGLRASASFRLPTPAKTIEEDDDSDSDDEPLSAGSSFGFMKGISMKLDANQNAATGYHWQRVSGAGGTVSVGSGMMSTDMTFGVLSPADNFTGLLQQIFQNIGRADHNRGRSAGST